MEEVVQCGMYHLVGKENFTVFPGTCRLQLGLICILFVIKCHIHIQGLGQHFQTLVSKTVLTLSINRGIHTRS